MNDIPQWRLDGDWFDVCKCDVPCPCEFARPPTYGDCDGVLVWHVREGVYGDVMLDLYAEDAPIKVEDLAAKLDYADYIVITSNRVYGSVAQLPTRYPMTIEYYERLFSEELGFDHVASITSPPSLGPIDVDDQSGFEDVVFVNHLERV